MLKVQLAFQCNQRKQNEVLMKQTQNITGLVEALGKQLQFEEASHRAQTQTLISLYNKETKDLREKVDQLTTLNDRLRLKPEPQPMPTPSKA